MRTLFRSARATLSKRPLCFACGLFLVVLFGVLYFEWAYALIAGIICLALAIGCLFMLLLRLPRAKLPLAFLSGGLIAASIAMLAGHTTLWFGYHRSIDRLSGESGQAIIVVTRPTGSTAYSASCEGKLISLNSEEVGLEGIFYFPYEASLETGYRLMAEISLTPIREDGSDLSDCYSLSQGLLFKAQVSDEGHLRLGEEEAFPYSLTQPIKDTLSGILRLYLPDEACELAKALLIGDKSGLSPELSEAFRQLGISHTLAVSGLHLGILLGSLSWLLKKVHLPRRAHLWVLLPITLLYMLLVGSASVMRAGGMLLLLLFAHPFGRRRDPLTSLFVSVSVICLISPFSALDIGLLLSFFSTFGILLVGLPLTERSRSLPSPLRRIADSLILTASATTFTLPFSIWYFGEVSLISPLANLLFVPLITLLLYLIPLLILFSPLPLLAAAPAYALRILSDLTVTAAMLLGKDELFMLSLELPAIQLFGLIVLVLCIGLLCFRRLRPTVIACAALFLTVSGGYFYFHTLEIAEQHTLYAYSEGENDALLLRDGTRVMICDASDGSYAFLSSAVKLAESDPAIRVDSLLLTHYHSRILSALTRLLEDSSIEYLILPLPDSEHADLAAVLEARAERGGCKVRYYSQTSCLVDYHGYHLVIDTQDGTTHPLNALSVSYNGKPLVCYAAGTGSEQSWNQKCVLLPASHHSELSRSPDLWNQHYD